ncbi:ATP-dependent helicase [Brevibacillus sp. B_LB10_24]|uniref:ATP-dependent helicase n=1 Tax=Brevibacillus sp. B_LB10_24 TaxID=3380645 RepID=UPI0038B75C78
MQWVYTPSQNEAIEYRGGHLLIIACAGSGKTEVISKRISQLVSEGVKKEEIVAFTFTEKAAEELKARIRKHLEILVPSDPELGPMYVGTIHSFCLQLLKEIEPNYRNYEVIDEIRQAAFIASNFRDIGLDQIQGENGYFTTINRFINTLKVLHVEGISVRNIRNPLLANCVRKYRELLTTRPRLFLDFNMIIDELLLLLRNDHTKRELVRSRFKHIVVDEYQDVDPRQEELIQNIVGSSTSLCVVGDDDQAIYGWRGASVDNILTFEQRYKNVKRVNLTENFRSTHAIVEIADTAIRRLPANRRLNKSMIAQEWVEESKSFREKMAEKGDIQRRSFSNENEEAKYIADQIEYLRGVCTNRDGAKGLNWGDMAVLLRSVKSTARPIIEELRSRGIPCVVRGIGGLFDSDEVRLIQAAFCQLSNKEFPHLNEQGERVYYDDARTRQFIRQTIISLRGSSEMPHADETAFLEWIAAKRRELEIASLPKGIRPRTVSRRVFPQDLFHEMLEVLGANRGPEAWPDRIMYNLGQFSKLITQYESIHQWITPYDLFWFNVFLENWASEKIDEGGLDDPSVINAVQILTIHAAKGLEWPVVFLPEISSRIFPSSQRNRVIEVFLQQSECNLDNYKSGDEGERRLWYVALTRSKKFLHITSVNRPRKKPTEYYNEIKHDYVRDDGIDPTTRFRSDPSTIGSKVELFPTNYSDLNYYWQCPQDYRLRRLMGFGPTIGQEFGYGQQIHNLLTAIHEHAQNSNVTKEWLDQLVDQQFNLRYTTGNPYDLMKEAAKRTLGKYIERFDNINKLVYHPEKPFEFVLEDALISGTIDLLEEINGATGERTPVSVVEFKTGSIDADNFEERLDNVEKQMRLYALATRDALRMDPVNAKVHFLSPEEVQNRAINISEDMQQIVRDNVRDAVTGIKNGQFERKPSDVSRCSRCDFKLLCPGSK